MRHQPRERTYLQQLQELKELYAAGIISKKTLMETFEAKPKTCTALVVYDEEFAMRQFVRQAKSKIVQPRVWFGQAMKQLSLAEAEELHKELMWRAEYMGVFHPDPLIIIGQNNDVSFQSSRLRSSEVRAVQAAQEVASQGGEESSVRPAVGSEEASER